MEGSRWFWRFCRGREVWDRARAGEDEEGGMEGEVFGREEEEEEESGGAERMFTRGELE